MKTGKLGRTGLTVTVAGLGTGGHSRIGYFKYGPAHAASLVRTAFDSGVNFFDSASAYGTEEAVGASLKGVLRDRYVLSTKFRYENPDGGYQTETDLMESIENSLRALQTDCIDVYHIHGVLPEAYPHVREVYIPALQKAQQQGKIRFPGITERFAADTFHKMFHTALADNFFDVVMVGYNLLNPSAAKTVLPVTEKNGVGTLCMFAVREAISKPASLKKNIAHIFECGQANERLSPEENLSFLVEAGGAGTLMEAAYRFCHHTPGIDVVLTGTGSPDHLRDNIRSIEKPPLSPSILERLNALFGEVDCVNGE